MFSSEVACENFLLGSYALCVRICAVLKKKCVGKSALMYIFFSFIVISIEFYRGSAREVSRGSVAQGSVFCRNPSDVTFHPFSIYPHYSSTATNIS